MANVNRIMIQLPIDFDNGRNEPLHPQADLEMTEMTQ